jgi:hypothetical protein
MDSKHDPLMISVTYTYDAIFLAFTEQVYQNQQDQRQQQDQINRLNLIRQSFAVMATLAIILSLFSVFFAYLLARRKFETDLKRAKELPRREVADIETDPPLKVPVRSLFLSAIIIFPLFFSPVMMADGQIIEQDRVIWEGVYDLGRDLELTEYISMEIPTQREFIYVYTDTEIATLTFYDEFGNELAYDTEPNRFKIDNPGLKFNYELERPYTVHNNSNMLVWLDRFWLEFSKPVIDFGDDDPFFNVDMSYSVLLPEDAILYSASPSELLNPIVFDNRRYEISFADTNRRMDAFHDVFETQITFSFIGILDALENLDSDFLQVKPEEPDINSLIQVAAQEVLIFAILGIIAPLISFLIAYWVFRRRYQKMIDRAEREQEEKIFVEGPQIMALSKATASDASERGTDAFMGHYYRGIEFLSTSLGTDVSRFDTPSIVNLVRKGGTSIDVQLLMEFLNLGTSVNPEDVIGYDQVHQINQLVEELIESTKEEEQ